MVYTLNDYVQVAEIEENNEKKFDIPSEFLSQGGVKGSGNVLVRATEDFYQPARSSPFGDQNPGYYFTMQGQDLYNGPTWKKNDVLVVDIIGLETFKYNERVHTIINQKYVKAVIRENEKE